ncbi:hypothetical protein [Actinomadura vinacea]
MDAFESIYRISLDCTLGVKIVEELKPSADGQFLTSTKDGSRMRRIATG